MIRTLRWRWWRVVAGVRLRRLGGRLVVDARGAPQLDGPLHLETGPRPGILTLTLGRGVRFGRDCVIELADGLDGTLDLGDGALLKSRIRLQPWGGAIRVGAQTQIRDGCELKSKGELLVGEGVICARHATVHCHEAVTIGDFAALAERVTITDSDHVHDGSDHSVMQQPILADAVVLGRNVLCATGAVVLRGTRVGANSVVAAGAVVTGGEHPSGWLIGGIPARRLKPLTAATHDDPPVPLR